MYGDDPFEMGSRKQKKSREALAKWESKLHNEGKVPSVKADTEGVLFAFPN